MFPQVTNKPFELEEIDDFPYTDYIDLQTKYEELEAWWTGEVLDVTQEQGGNQIDVYPLKLNPVRGAILKHAYALFGEFPDDMSGSLVVPKTIIRDESEREEAEKIDQALFNIWYDNNGAAIQMENGTLSQIYGGCIFKVSWVPTEDVKIRVERIHAKEFIGIPHPNNFWRLKEAWVVRKITKRTAEEYGVAVTGEFAYYIEHWTESEYSYAINDTPLVENVFGSQYIYNGPNPYRFVPFVYIPHQRAGDFYGDSLVTPAVDGIVKELNLRTADAGDATNDQSHSVMAIRNVRGIPQVVKIANRISVVNLGNNQAMGNSDEPDMFSVTRSQITDAMLKLNDELQNHFRREVMVPSIAEGEDEGSQRSAATLTARMWPLTSHVKSERAFWTTGLIIFNTMILKIAAQYGYEGIKTSHLKAKLKIKWYPILPRDRQAFVEELVARAGVNLGSPQHLMELIGDIDDVEMDMDLVKEWVKFVADTQKAVNMEARAAKSGSMNLDKQGKANVD